MPIEIFGEDAEATPTPVAWRDGVVCLLQPVPATVDDRISARAARGVKLRKALDQTLTAAGREAVERTRGRAVYALRDTEGFDLVTRSPEVAAAVGKALGADVPLGKAIRLDGRWTDDVKEAVLLFIPKLAAWISNEADKLARQDAEEEADLGKI